LTSHAYNKDYSLSVSTDALTLANNAANTTGAISLSTSYTGGYTAAVTDGNWLTISAGGSSTTATTDGQVNTITVRASAANATGSPRTGTVTVTSGALTRTVTVTQPAAAVAKTFTVANALSVYPANGGLQTLAVTSNCEWYATVDYLKSDIVVSFDAGVFTGNKNFGFTLIDNDPAVVFGDDLSATFTFYSPANEFTPVSRTVKLPAASEPYNPDSPNPPNGWAGSNIYWDGSKLTFDNVGVTTHQYYQGVYFQWGSLWGLDASYPASGNWSTSKTVYKPNAAANGWTSATGYAWTAIPYAGSSDVGTGTTSSDNLYGIHNPSTGKGDICRYITDVAGGSLHSKKWRMPTYNEFSNAGWASSKTGTFSDVSNSASSATGTWQNSNYPGWRTTSGVFFPASGYRRTFSTGYLNYVGDNGFYWSSSALVGDGASFLTFASTYGDAYMNPRGDGMSVRCVSY
jgi:uncharacterized protein (TIGR02145 family)